MGNWKIIRYFDTYELVLFCQLGDNHLIANKDLNTQVPACLINFQTRFSRELNLKRNNFIAYFAVILS